MQKIEGKSIGITGGSGFIGHHLINELVQRDARVFVLDKKEPKFNNENVTWLNGDVRDSADANLLLQCSIIFNLAAESNVMRAENNPEYALSTSLLGARNMSELTKSGVFVVHASSREVYGQPLYTPVCEQHPIQPKNVYGISKAVAERFLLGRSTILRFSNVIGTHDNNFERVLPNWLLRSAKGEKLVLFGGSQLIDFIPAKYVINALITSAEEKIFETINIGSGIAISLLQLLSRIKEIYPFAEADLQPARSAEVTSYLAETSKMRSILGIDPPIDPLEDLHEIATYYDKVARPMSDLVVNNTGDFKMNEILK
jgi:UDP-glucose 4-epimerase